MASMARPLFGAFPCRHPRIHPSPAQLASIYPCLALLPLNSFIIHLSLDLFTIDRSLSLSLLIRVLFLALRAFPASSVSTLDATRKLKLLLMWCLVELILLGTSRVTHAIGLFLFTVLKSWSTFDWWSGLHSSVTFFSCSCCFQHWHISICMAIHL